MGLEARVCGKCRDAPDEEKEPLSPVLVDTLWWLICRPCRVEMFGELNETKANEQRGKPSEFPTREPSEG